MFEKMDKITLNSLLYLEALVVERVF